jgi:hypothetical protein
MVIAVVGILFALVMGLSAYLWYVTPEPHELARK